jgi:hypothetical protein
MAIIYLAGPYSKGGARTRLARFEALTTIAARMIELRLIIFSPITMTHPIDLVLANEGGTLGSEFWVAFDESFMAACSEIRVAKLPGWQQSSGVEREIAFFKNRGIEPVLIEPSDFGVRPDVERFAAAFDPSL